MKIDRCQMTAKACGLAVALSLWALPGQGASVLAPFNVTVNLQPGDVVPATGLCTVTGAFADRVTVACSAANFHFLFSPRTDFLTDNETGYAGVGVATSWRMVSLGNRDYIEMTVRW